MYDEILYKLSQSHFRNRFRLSEKDKTYAREKGYATIKKHAADFIAGRVAPDKPANDGKQTPMRGHPVFIAQHATACCCRQCIYKWHRFPPEGCLNEKQQAYLVGLIMEWITRQLQKQSDGKQKSPE